MGKGLKKDVDSKGVMARPLRVEFPGAVYHVTARGNERKVDVARDLGYRDGGSVLQIIKRLEKSAQENEAWARKKPCYEKEMSSVEGVLPKTPLLRTPKKRCFKIASGAF